MSNAVSPLLLSCLVSMVWCRLIIKIFKCSVHFTISKCKRIRSSLRQSLFSLPPSLTLSADFLTFFTFLSLSHYLVIYLSISIDTCLCCLLVTSFHFCMLTIPLKTMSLQQKLFLRCCWSNAWVCTQKKHIQPFYAWKYHRNN